jgi:hypothetical protein
MHKFLVTQFSNVFLYNTQPLYETVLLCWKSSILWPFFSSNKNIFNMKLRLRYWWKDDTGRSIYSEKYPRNASSFKG